MNKDPLGLLEYINSMEIIDTHEHLPGREDVYLSEDRDVLTEMFGLYLQNDLVSSGLSSKDSLLIQDLSIPISKRWSILSPFWELIKLTGYGQMIEIALNDLLGKKLNRDSIEEIDSAYQEKIRPGCYDWLLREKSKIKFSVLDKRYLDPDNQKWVSVLDIGKGFDDQYFRPVFRMDDFIFPNTMTDIEYIEEKTGIQITCLDDWLEACELVLDRAITNGAVGIKSALAYKRSLKFNQVDKSRAEKAFSTIFEKRISMGWRINPIHLSKDFQDYMMHAVLRMANKRKLIFQIHTGLQAGNGNIINNSDPSKLNIIFMQYPDVKFDVFHIGFPYQHILGQLAKTFPNVYIDMCWAHIISPQACVNSLCEWIESVPVNKIMAFGGDLDSLFSVYGHQKIARRNVYRAIQKKIDEQLIDINEGKEIAKRIFYKNPKQLFDREI